MSGAERRPPARRVGSNADLQSAVSQNCILRGSRCSSDPSIRTASRLQIGDTADCKSALHSRRRPALRFSGAMRACDHRGSQEFRPLLRAGDAASAASLPRFEVKQLRRVLRQVQIRAARLQFRSRPLVPFRPEQVAHVPMMIFQLCDTDRRVTLAAMRRKVDRHEIKLEPTRLPLDEHNILRGRIPRPCFAGFKD